MRNGDSLPWQKTAKYLIEYALRYQDSNNEFERQIGYLVLDVGVETLFRVFVTQPGAGYAKRDKIAKGTIEKANIQKNEVTLSSFDELGFHALTEMVKKIAGEKINKEDIDKVKYFHNIRNKIYHLGDGIVPTKENFEEYLIIAQNLLDKLLLNSGDEKNELWETDVDAQEAVVYSLYINETQNEFDDLCHDISIATAIFMPRYATRSFEEGLKQLEADYVDVLEYSLDLPQSLTDVTESELIKNFNKLTGWNIEDLDFIIEVCKDVAYFRLAILLKLMGEDVNKEIESYTGFRLYANNKTETQKPITNDNIKEFKEFKNWIVTMRKKISTSIEEKISKS